MGTFVVVDDELMVRELYAAWLNSANYTVLTADSVAEAQRLLEDQQADVLFSDIKMAQATGIDLLAWVRRHDPDMPVILITGAPAVDTAVEALRLGAYDYLLKPVTENTLLHAAQQALEHRNLLREKQRLEEENRRYQQHLEELVAQRTAMLERRTQQLLTLHQVTQAVNALKGKSSLYRRTVELVHDALGYPSVAIYVVDEQAGVLYLAAAAGLHCALEPNTQQPQDQGLLGLAVRERRIIIAQDVRQWPEHLACPDVDTRSEAVFPVLIDGKPTALLLVGHTRPNAFDETDQVVLQALAEHLHIALTNTRLYIDLQEALQAREQMLQNVSHELRTPLTLIRGYAELLQGVLQNWPGEEPQEAVQTIIQQADHLTKLVDQLIMFQEVRQSRTEREIIDLDAWLQTIAYAWRVPLQEKGLELRLEIAKQLGQTVGNQQHLTQVMYNLLDNSRKFSPKGGIVTLQAHRGEDEVTVSVSDQGVGVPLEKLPRLFERFYQVDGSMTRRFGGMGLGLALAKEIVQAHGGHIWAESEGEGKGLTVSFTLPLMAESG